MLHHFLSLVLPVTRGGGTVEVVKGNRATMVCDASAYPFPTITWFKDGDKLFGKFNISFYDKDVKPSFLV